jgi:drug/metabolite transporter (DMT)-like permease
MTSQVLKSNLLLLLTAVIWGFAFVAQRVGAAYMGPFAFNGIRFALGSVSLLPLILFFRVRSSGNGLEGGRPAAFFGAGLTTGLVLFAGASLQQVGLMYADTTAGKAAFITSLYIVLVPILGIFIKRYAGLSSWLGAIVALAGLYFLCIKQDFTISFGDLLELAGAFFWAAHILLIDHFVTRKVDALKLACTQFAVCAALSLAAALIFETITAAGIRQALIPILYGGILSTGVAYTLQIFGQKHARPAPAAIIMSMETVFAAAGGAVILGESLEARGILGCAFMLAGMLLSQLQNFYPPSWNGRRHPGQQLT